MKPCPCRAALVAAIVLAPNLAADDWPQWRGPNRDGRSAETGLLATWPQAGPPKAWSASGFGTGFSSVAVAGGLLYTMGDLKGAEPVQYLIAAREKDGGIVWKQRVGPVWEDEYAGPRATPTVAAGRVYALGTEGDLMCAQATDGKVLWRRNILKDFSGEQMAYDDQYLWKVSESPLVDGDRVIITPGGKTALLAALDAATGKDVWRTAVDRDLGSRGDDGTAYSSVVISNGGGVKQYVQQVGRGVVGVDAKSGKLLWNYNRVANRTANVSTPIVSGDLVFASTGYQTGSAALRLAAASGGVTATEVYFLPHTTFQNHHGNLILDQGTIYAGHGHNRGNPIAIDLATGAVKWGPADNAGQGSAAVAFAQGRVYLRYQNGIMVLVEATPEGYRERGSFPIPGVSQPSWSHPVIANGHLLLREQDQIHAYKLTAR